MLTRQAMRVVRGVSKPGGFNLGINQGAVASRHSRTCTSMWFPAGSVMSTSCDHRPDQTGAKLLAETRALIAAAWDTYPETRPGRAEWRGNSELERYAGRPAGCCSP